MSMKNQAQLDVVNLLIRFANANGIYGLVFTHVHFLAFFLEQLSVHIKDLSRPQTGEGTDSDQREQGTSRRQRAGQDP